MKNKDFKVSRSCFICPYRAQAHDREQFANEQEIIYRWRCVVWGRVIECISRADALAELRRQCTIEVVFARHSRPLTMAEYFALDLRYQFTIDEVAGIAYCNGKKYGNIAQI
jgi:hypothetical protein